MPNWKDFVDPDAPSGRYLRWKEVERSAGISRTTAWRLQRAGDFPRPYVISPGRVGYLEAEVDAWRISRGRRGMEYATIARQTPATITPPRASAVDEPAPGLLPERSCSVSAPRPGSRARARRTRVAARQVQMQLDL
ncbi:MAG: AlpA family phage regulatory protein [Phenylobacterium sp.]|uniref:helix-turn-helix transcriptional regulator n=1 Tax=Phenylobacterium sp. TaxID=1871053 RepID=UPI00122BC7F7|nr:AlpA family phage regulatory protein [Phenylobacterium sp.]TAJ68782.1 MAG: AlpA family phage regulatory protein [Phenylobacterium sp.]